MAILGVGIFNNLVINKVTKNTSEQGLSLDVTFKSVGEQPSSDDSLDFLSAGDVGNSNTGSENNIRIYGIQLVGYDGNTKDGDTLLNELLAKQKQLVHIASPYFTSEVIKKAWELTKGTKITTKAELVKGITLEATLYKLTDNLFTQFEALMKPVVGEDSKKVMVKFTRKSKASNFPKLTDKFLDSQPFIASMEDTATMSKIKFSKYDIENGFDSNAQSLDGADSQTADELASQTAAVNSVFG